MTQDWEQPPGTGRRGQLVGVLAVSIAVAALLAGRITAPEADETRPTSLPCGAGGR